MNHLRLSLLAMALTGFAATTEAQQGPGRLTAGVFGGITLPSGDFGDEVGNGWHAGALAKMRLYGVLDLRADGTFNKLGKKDIIGTIATVTTDAQLIHGNLDLLINLGPDSAAYPGDNSVSPYIMAGAGSYNLDYKADCTGTGCSDFDDPGSRNHFGVNIGGGATFPLGPLRTFVEGRYHRISRSFSEGSSRSMILISAGVKFR